MIFSNLPLITTSEYLGPDTASASHHLSIQYLLLQLISSNLTLERLLACCKLSWLIHLLSYCLLRQCPVCHEPFDLCGSYSTACTMCP